MTEQAFDELADDLNELAQALALLAWAQERDGIGMWRASDLAIAEAAAIVNAVGEAAGQRQLL